MNLENFLEEEVEELTALYKLYNENMCTIEDLKTVVEFIGTSGFTGKEFKSFLRGSYPNMVNFQDSWEVDTDKLIEESDEALRFVSHWNKLIKKSYKDKL